MPHANAEEVERKPDDDPIEGQIAICTRDETCQAPADEHLPDCPVEAKLKATFGF